MFVHPEQVAEVVKRHPEISKARLVVDSVNANDVMTLHCETTNPDTDGLADKLQQTVRDVCKLKGEVALVAPDTLANDGKVIDDVRTYE
jgi:phenylacetate-CoA ligase